MPDRIILRCTAKLLKEIDIIPSNPQMLVLVTSGVYVKDVDATYRRALDAGAVSIQEPVKKQDEDKRGGVKDGGGTTWWIATKVE